MDYLGTHNDKMCAYISTGNNPNTPQFIQPNYLGYFWKKALITCPLSMFGRIRIASGDDYLNSILIRLSYFIEPHIFSLNHGNKYELFSNERTGKK